MKKKIGMIGLAAAAMVAGMAGQQTSTSTGNATIASQTTEQPGTPQQTPQPGVVVKKVQFQVHRSYAMPVPEIRYPNEGMGPKQWGQYLQNHGKQKWTKKQRA